MKSRRFHWTSLPNLFRATRSLTGTLTVIVNEKMEMFCEDTTDDARGLFARLQRYHVVANPLRKRYAVFEFTESYGRVATDNTVINLHDLYDS